MVIVVVGDGAGLEGLRASGGQVKVVDSAFAIVEDQALAIGRPIGRLDGIGRGVDHFAMAGGYLQQFEVAAQGHLSPLIGLALVGGRDARVAKDAGLRYIGVMGADEEAYIDLIAQVEAHSIRLKGFSIDCCTHNILIAFSLQLEDIGVGELELVFFRLGAGRAAKLERSEPVAMFDGIDMCRVAGQALADHPAYFTVIVDPGTQELRPGVKNEITFYLPVNILEFVVVGPNIITRTGDDILAGFRNIGCRSGFDIGADIGVAFEDADGLCGSRLREKDKDRNKKQQSVSMNGFHQMAIKRF